MLIFASENNDKRTGAVPGNDKDKEIWKQRKHLSASWFTWALKWF